MKKLLLFISIGFGFCVTSCYKDKGNYVYKVPPAPVVTGLDSSYNAIIGDTLLIAPSVTIAESNHRLSYQWRIDIPAKDTGMYFNGPKLQYVFGLPAGSYYALLTITDSADSMKYFYPFTINGVTEYSAGTLILSQESGVSQLSFVAPDGTMQPRVYAAINGHDLPVGATQLVVLEDQYENPVTVSSYWIFGSGSIPGQQIDANTFLDTKTLQQNFFSAPASLVPGTMMGNASGTLQGVITGQLYLGTSSTWNESPVYGMFGQPAQGGTYNLYHQAAFNSTFPYFLGYDSVVKQIVGFTNFGGAAFIGTGYQVSATPAFDPTNVGLDLLDFEQINDQNCYAFGVGANDSIYELKFGAAFTGQIQLSPVYKRPFPRPDLITPATRWASTPTEVFYFSSGSNVYSYNPLNQQLTQLVMNFNGQAITMVKVTSGGNTLVAGVSGTVYFLDISTGKNGQLISQINNVPGSPVDVYQRTQ